MKAAGIISKPGVNNKDYLRQCGCTIDVPHEYTNVKYMLELKRMDPQANWISIRDLHALFVILKISQQDDGCH